MPSLLVIVPDAISVIVAKGEYQPRYYNPGNLFDEVHILMTNDDRVDPRDVQRTVGDAQLYLHNLPEDRRHFIQNYSFFKPWLLKPWAKPIIAITKRLQLWLLNRWSIPAIKLAREIRPALIRCHGNDYNAYIASRIKRSLGIPYVVSLHINPDVDTRKRVISPCAAWEDRLFNIFFDDIECIGLRQSDLALPVYKPIIPYLRRVGCQHYEVAYNVLNSDCLKRKESYTLHRPIRLLSVGRHFESKNPENIIRAIKELPDAHLTLVGDGPYQDRLRSLAKECGVENRVSFRQAIPNDDLCQQLPEYDIFVVHTEHWEVNKAVLEALLSGLPVIINRRIGEPVPELQGDFVVSVENTKEGYFQAVKKLIEDDTLREELGRKAYAYAQEHWAPEKTEAKYVEIYKRVMAKADTDAVKH